jgi:hypothetical protein
MKIDSIDRTYLDFHIQHGNVFEWLKEAEKYCIEKIKEQPKKIEEHICERCKQKYKVTINPEETKCLKK